MTTKTFLITLITLFLLTVINGCDGNEDICTFNVNDPINDLVWLKNEITKMDTPSYYVCFYLYQNKENPQKYFFHERVQVVGGGQQCVPGLEYIVIYNCKGDIIYKNVLSNFYEENTFVKQIWPEE